MTSELEKHGVTIVALSKDSQTEAAHHKQRDQLSFTLLSDPALVVIKLYGLEHHKALEFSKARFSLLGNPLALVPSIKKMAIPTSLLIDEKGVIRWIDQSEDYRLRSSEDHVLAAVQSVFGKSVFGKASEGPAH